MATELARFDWPAPWGAVTDGMQDAFEAELTKEIGSSHGLFGQRATATARSLEQDDVLFALADDRVAEVHLTWNRKTESDPRWPRVTLYSSPREWAADKARSAI